MTNNINTEERIADLEEQLASALADITALQEQCAMQAEDYSKRLEAVTLERDGLLAEVDSLRHTLAGAILQ